LHAHKNTFAARFLKMQFKDCSSHVQAVISYNWNTIKSVYLFE